MPIITFFLIQYDKVYSQSLQFIHINTFMIITHFDTLSKSHSSLNLSATMAIALKNLRKKKDRAEYCIVKMWHVFACFHESKQKKSGWYFSDDATIKQFDSPLST